MSYKRRLKICNHLLIWFHLWHRHRDNTQSDDTEKTSCFKSKFKFPLLSWLPDFQTTSWDHLLLVGSVISTAKLSIVRTVLIPVHFRYQHWHLALAPQWDWQNHRNNAQKGPLETFSPTYHSIPLPTTSSRPRLSIQVLKTPTDGFSATSLVFLLAVFLLIYYDFVCHWKPN